MSEVCGFLMGLKFGKEKLNLLVIKDEEYLVGEIRLQASLQAAINIVSSC